MKTRKIYEGKGVAPCYFRTTTCAPYKKAILQITERCNLHCKHCFVSAQHSGCVMSLEIIREHILQRLLKLNVIKVSLTGGEPFTHPNLFEICLLLAQNDIEVTICTNATLITKEDVAKFAEIPRLKFNVSLDGFSFNSHGRFRGLRVSEDFEILLTNIRNIGRVGKLNGLLCTPNFFCKKEEFENICQFGKANNAKYVLFNPLSSLGRGQKSLRFTIEEDGFDEIRKSTNHFVDDAFEVLHIRFPNREGKPLPQCVLGDMIYIFTNGDTTLCPYMVFACKNTRSPYSSDQFIIGNIISNDLDIDKYVNDSGLNNIVLKTKCSKEGCYGGCHAAKIMNGNKIDECDWDLCPIK